MIKPKNKIALVIGGAFFICHLLFFIGVEYSFAQGCLWVVDQNPDANAVIKLSADASQELLRLKGFDVPTFLDIDESDATIWITDTANYRVVQYSNSGEKLSEIKLAGRPYHLAICRQHRELWVADSDKGALVKFSLDTKKELLKIKGFKNPHDIIISPYDNSLWLSDEEGQEVIRLSHEGVILSRIRRNILKPKHLAIDPNDGSCWITNGDNHYVVKLASDGRKVLATVYGFGTTYMATVNPKDSTCWVSDLEKGELTKLSPQGKIIKKISGFDRCRGLSPIKEDGTFWLGNWGAGEIIKLNTEGEILSRIGGFKWPRLVVVDREN